MWYSIFAPLPRRVGPSLCELGFTIVVGEKRLRFPQIQAILVLDKDAFDQRGLCSIINNLFAKFVHARSCSIWGYP